MTARCLSKKSLFLPVSLPDRQQWLWEGTPKSRTFLRVKFGAQSVAVLRSSKYLGKYQRESMGTIDYKTVLASP